MVGKSKGSSGRARPSTEGGRASIEGVWGAVSEQMAELGFSAGAMRRYFISKLEDNIYIYIYSPLR